MDKEQRAKAQSELEAIEQKAKDLRKMLDEPEIKLEHGDYGYDDKNVPRLELDIGRDEYKIKHCTAGNSYVCLPSDEPNASHIKIKLGNIFDDLRRNSKDLREFSRRCPGNKFEVCLSGGCIDFYIESNYASLGMIEAYDAYQKLGQLIATAKRDKK